MNKIKAIILSLVFALSIWGASTQAGGPAIMFGVKKTVASSQFCDGFSGYLCEDFEGSSTCGDDAASQTTCRNTGWTSAGNPGTITNIATGMAGSYSKKLDDDSSDGSVYVGTYKTFTADSEVHAFALVKIFEETLTGNNVTVFSVRNSGGSAYCAIRVTGSTNKFAVGSSGTAFSDTTITPTADNIYAIWVDYTNNTTNTGCTVRIQPTVNCSGSPAACTATKPAATKELTTANWGNVDRIYFMAFDQTSFGDVDWIYYDNIKVSENVIGNNGQ